MENTALEVFREALLWNIDEDGAASVTRDVLDIVFPHPIRLSRAEMEDAITDALSPENARVELPSDETQEEQITAFCETHDLLVWTSPEDPEQIRHFRTLQPKPPRAIRELLKASPRECKKMGDMVGVEAIEAKGGKGDYVHFAITATPPQFMGPERMGGVCMEKLAITTWVFQKQELLNGSHVFTRVS